MERGKTDKEERALLEATREKPHETYRDICRDSGSQRYCLFLQARNDQVDRNFGTNSLETQLKKNARGNLGGRSPSIDWSFPFFFCWGKKRKRKQPEGTKRPGGKKQAGASKEDKKRVRWLVGEILCV
jgi:hypothetical protein